MKSKIAIIEQLNVLVIVFFVSSIQSLLFDIHAICSELINFTALCLIKTILYKCRDRRAINKTDTRWRRLMR